MSGTLLAGHRLSLPTTFSKGSFMTDRGQPNGVISKTNSDSTRSERLLVSAQDAASLCNKSLRTWRNWNAAGRIPRPVRIGRSTLWRLAELHEWVDAGCPPRQEWEARQ